MGEVKWLLAQYVVAALVAFVATWAIGWIGDVPRGARLAIAAFAFVACAAWDTIEFARERRKALTAADDGGEEKR